MQEPVSERRFNREEIGELIETASRLDQLSQDPDPGLTLSELRSIASELGISDQALLEAVAKRMEGERQEATTKHKVSNQWRERVRHWQIHLGSYLSVIFALSVIDLADGTASLDWVFFPAAGWGIGLLIHSVVVAVNRPE